MQKGWKSSRWSSTTDGGRVFMAGSLQGQWPIFCPSAGCCALELPVSFHDYWRKPLSSKEQSLLCHTLGAPTTRTPRPLCPRGNLSALPSSIVGAALSSIYTSLPPSSSSSRPPLAFLLMKVRSPNLHSPRSMLQRNFNQATHIKSQGEANHKPEHTQPGCQPTLSCCGWSAV